MRVKFLGESRYPISAIRRAMVSFRSSTEEFDEIKMLESGLGLMCEVCDGDELDSAGDRGGGNERNSSWRRMDEGGVGGQVENQVCMVGTSDQDEVSCCSTDESETVELLEDRIELGMLSASETCEVADSLFGTTRGAAGSESTRPKPASEDSESRRSGSSSLRMSSGTWLLDRSRPEACRYDEKVKSLKRLAPLPR